MDILECVLNFFYPPVCGICNKENEMYICKECLKMLKFIAKNQTCKYQTLDELLYIFEYEGIIRQKILDYKFKDKAYLHSTFSRLIIENQKNIEYIKNFDIIIPVPIHKERLKERGYNQSFLIARDISRKITNLKLENNILIKNKNIVAQSTLNKLNRKENIKGVYNVLSTEKIVGKNVLLFDDIYTTGSTLKECAKMLKMAGAKKVRWFGNCKRCN